MNALRQWILGVLAAATLGFAVLAAIVLVRFNAPPPALDGTATIAGADGVIEIVRDAHGVPHIFATTEPDLYRGLGFVHAQDRFFQMDATRRYMQGRLAELVGDLGLKSDAQARIMNWAGVAEAQYARLRPETRALLEAYAQGVNAQLAIGPTPPEYALFFAAPESWRPLDSMAISLAITNQLSGGREFDSALRRLSERLTEQEIAEFLIGYPDWAPRSYPSLSSNTGRPASRAAATDSERSGSNAWVVSGVRTGTGMPILANDPHLPLGAPGPFHLARLQGPNGVLIGAALPGAPLIVIGRTDYVAWGLTTHQVDVEDELPLAGAAITEERVDIRVRTLGLFHRTVSFTARRTADGPVLEPRWFDDLEGHEPVVLRTIADDEDNLVAEAMSDAARARTVDDFFDAVTPWKAPLQNVVVADAHGNIGLVSPGRFPARDGAGRWVGEIPTPIHATNPAAGFLATANNLQTPRDFPYPMPGSHDAYRVARIVEVLSADTAHNADRAAALQFDRVSVLAGRLREAIAAGAPRTEAGRAMQARLGAWDGVADPARIEPTLFAYWTRAIGAALYADELGEELFETAQGPRDAFIDAVLTGRLPAIWCDDVATAPVQETCADAVGEALDAAAASVVRDRGADEAGWRWGEVHAARFPHPVLSGLPLVGESFTVEAPVGGNSSTVNVARNWHRNSGYNTVHAAGMRMIIDFADLNASRFMLAPGQSGHPRSPHYGDLAPLWAAGEYFEIRSDWTPQTAPDGAHLWRLAPAR
ncbi:MAG: penicillin acylase family protein [Hyphomonadaceae bacterium]|nr:penicillin acylase family protein [Hyphomonadaceae bacterium]